MIQWILFSNVCLNFLGSGYVGAATALEVAEVAVAVLYIFFTVALHVIVDSFLSCN